MKRKQAVSTFSMRLPKETGDVLTMYAKAMHKPRGRIVRELLEENLVHMVLVCNRYESEEEIKKDPKASEWTK